MADFERKLTKTEVNHGLISVAGIREHFPSRGEKIIVYDDEGEKYETKMHSTAARIDRLTKWYKNHPTAKIGDSILVTVNPDKSIKLSINKGKEIFSEDEREDETSVIEIVPRLEQILEDFLEKNLEHLEKGLRLYRDDDGIPGRQYSTDIGIIDLLCIDKNERFVILEIKRDKGSDKVIGQVTRYMGWVKENLSNNKEVRGIIIVHEIDKKLEYSASILRNVEIKYYKIDLKFVTKQELL